MTACVDQEMSSVKEDEPTELSCMSKDLCDSQPKCHTPQAANNCSLGTFALVQLPEAT